MVPSSRRRLNSEHVSTITTTPTPNDSERQNSSVILNIVSSATHSTATVISHRVTNDHSTFHIPTYFIGADSNVQYVLAIGFIIHTIIHGIILAPLSMWLNFLKDIMAPKAQTNQNTNAMPPPPYEE